MKSYLNNEPIPPSIRQKFEEAVFNRRFLSSLQINDQKTGFQMISADCPTKAELLEMDEDGTCYKDPQVSAMWYGFRLAWVNREEIGSV